MERKSWVDTTESITEHKTGVHIIFTTLLFYIGKTNSKCEGESTFLDMNFDFSVVSENLICI